jgi:hypothetical protein
MSPHHLTFGAAALKSDLTRSGTFGAFSSWRVNPLLRLGLRAHRRRGCIRGLKPPVSSRLRVM